jgi:hypothetical protein
MGTGDEIDLSGEKVGKRKLILTQARKTDYL